MSSSCGGTRCTPACPLYLPILPLQGCRGSGGTLGPVQCACVCGEEASSFGTVCCTTHQGRCVSSKCSLCAAPHKDTELACGCLEFHAAQCCVGGDQVNGQAGEPSSTGNLYLVPWLGGGARALCMYLGRMVHQAATLCFQGATLWQAGGACEVWSAALALRLAQSWCAQPLPLLLSSVAVCRAGATSHKHNHQR